MKRQFASGLKRLVKTPYEKHYLIAASSGLDSTVLIHLCHTLKLNFAICHVNFKLRGENSDKDQKFLEELSITLNCPIFVLEKNAKIYAKTNQLSTQEAARVIRYTWFKDCLHKHNYDLLMTAHHADDDLETYLINSFRGTGIKGLTGIAKKRDHIIRPMIGFKRKDILNYAKKGNINWREDQSNASDHYLRNVIRHHVIPFFANRQDDLHARFKTTQDNINRQDKLLDDYLNIAFNQVVKQTEDSYQFNIKTLKEFAHPKYLLIELLKDFGFTDWDSIYNLTTAQVGKHVTSSNYKLVKERGFLELFVIKESTKKNTKIKLDNLPKKINFKHGQLYFEDTTTFEKTGKNIAFISKDLLKNDLFLRPYQIGDYFCPLGMKGRRKLSDFLKDEKLSTFEKSKTWVLHHQNEIVWVIKHRIDDRYKITDKTKECLKITYSE